MMVEADQVTDDVGLPDQILEYLRQVDRFQKNSLRSMFGLRFMPDRDFGLLLHDVLQTLVAENRVFAPSCGWYRLASAKGVHGRALTFGRAARRKADRGVKLAYVAACIEADPEEKHRLERSALRQANRALTESSELARAKTPKPAGLKKS
jgi:hypothetical protein